MIDVRWDEVARVGTWKRDLFTIDDICLFFECYDGRRVFTSEEYTDGFSALSEAAARELGFPESWFGDVMQPPFATCEATLVDRDDPRSGAPVVIIPGLDGTGHLLTEFVRAAPRGVRPQVIPYFGGRLADIVDQVLEELPDQPVPLIAESFGSLVAAHLVHRVPERVTAVAIVGGFCRSPIPRMTGWFPIRSLLRVPVSRALAANRATDGDVTWADRLLAVRAGLDHGSVAKRVRAIARASTEHLWADFRKPVMILHGTRDRTVPIRCAEELARAIPNAQRVDVDGAHFMLEMMPAEVWERLAPIL